MGVAALSDEVRYEHGNVTVAPDLLFRTLLDNIYRNKDNASIRLPSVFQADIYISIPPYVVLP